MRMSVCRVSVMFCLGVLALLGTVADASAQYRGPAPAAVGEEYHIEAAYGWWDASPSLIVNSESLEILGTDVNLIEDLGIEQRRLGKFNLILRPGRKHRFRFERLPIHYEADATVKRSFVFNGQTYNVGLPVQTVANFDTYRFGYEFDFLYKSKGFLGALLEMKYTNVNVELQSPIGSEFTKATAPIPTVGLVGRGYILPKLAINGEVSLFRMPEGLATQLDGRGTYTDFDFNATYNFNRYVGAQAGYRKVNIFYDVDLDSGTLKFTGIYFGGVVRY
jgi:hypothetical protein